MGGLRGLGGLGRMGGLRRLGGLGVVRQVRRVGVRAKASECMELGMWGRLWDRWDIVQKNFAKKL